MYFVAVSFIYPAQIVPAWSAAFETLRRALSSHQRAEAAMKYVSIREVCEDGELG
jgi:hypothetical protein